MQLDSPWAEKAAETPAHSKQAEQPAGGSLRELLPDGLFGNPEVVLKEAGFEVGDLVRRKKDRKECKIIAVKKKDLRLQDLESNEAVKASIQSLLDKERCVYTARPEPMVFEDLMPFSPENSLEWQAHGHLDHGLAETLAHL